LLSGAWRLLIGRPLKSSESAKEEITAPEGLAALSLDALTSVAYGPEAIVVVLATAGVGALSAMVPITIAIVVLLALLVFSYRQVIDAYPAGGGAYAVSRDNLGEGASRVAAAALIVDYVLTVAVSIAAGVGALTSAFTGLKPWTVALCLGILALLTILNLRGVGDSARAFLLPTFLFIVGIFGIIIAGFLFPAHPSGIGQPGFGPTTEVLGVLLILKAFASGCSALTGVEAIANGVPLFREPRIQRAKLTELLLGLILGVMLLGLAILGTRFHVGPPTNQTVLSQIMADAVGRSWFYYVVSLSVTVVLALAANTSFGGLPILLSLLARNNLVPHVFALRGERLVFQFGVGVLAVLSAVLLIVVGGDTQALIPLFAIGVFTGFTLSQSGMVVHWFRGRPRGWRRRALLNGLGALGTALATLIFLFTKFLQGGWVVVVAVPLLIFMFHQVHSYYDGLGKELGLGKIPPPLKPAKTLVIVPVVAVSNLTDQALVDAKSLGDDVIAVSVHFDDEPRSDLREQWNRWNPGVKLVQLESPYHSVTQPLVEFVSSRCGKEHERVVVLIPEIVPQHIWENIFHNQRATVLSSALRRHTTAIVCRLAFHVNERGATDGEPATVRHKDSVHKSQHRA
jgi:amino acid transporter